MNTIIFILLVSFAAWAATMYLCVTEKKHQGILGDIQEIVKTNPEEAGLCSLLWLLYSLIWILERAIKGIDSCLREGDRTCRYLTGSCGEKTPAMNNRQYASKSSLNL